MIRPSLRPLAVGALVLVGLQGCSDSPTPTPDTGVVTDVQADRGPSSDQGSDAANPTDTVTVDAVTDIGTDAGAVDTGIVDVVSTDNGNVADASDGGTVDEGVDVVVVPDSGTMDATMAMDSTPGMDAVVPVDVGFDAGQDVVPDRPVDLGQDMGPLDMGVRCMGNPDCASSLQGPICDTVSGRCVQCVPGNNMQCPAGQFCTPDNICLEGCATDDNCAALIPDGGTGNRFCDPNTRRCVACNIDTHCPQGNICISNACVPGCSNNSSCMNGQSCCAGACINTNTDIENCGGCGRRCNLPNVVATCVAGMCEAGACATPYANCDNDAMNGCEANLRTSPNHCGACGTSCTQGNTCRSGRCEPTEIALFYPLDGDGAEGMDMTANAMVMGAVTAVADRFAVNRSAVNLNGNGAYLQTMPNPRLPFGPMPRTLSIWFRTSASFTGSRIGTLVNYGTAETGRRFGLRLQQNAVSFVGEGRNITTTAALNNNVWHMATATYNGTAVVLYVDGVEVGRQDFMLDTSIPQLVIGRATSDVTTPDYFEGDLDEVRVYREALTTQQILALYRLGGFGS